MNISDIPHDMTFKFGPNLREVPLNKMDMLHGMMYLQKQLDDETLKEAEKGKLHGLLGYFLRVIGELNESKKHLNQAITIFRELNRKQSVFVNRLRLANTYQWHNDFDTSNKMFDELLKTAENDPDYAEYRDFVYQHQGKNLFDQEKYREALDYFHKALELRTGNRNSELIKSTETAIETCEKKINN
ncbi:MAG TPA: tetratricopeptide repeat protein [Lentibacillus sp.]|uniref:tetratricopeptide repeat protein n=1 Tax=Lentibacillus sp. TaxID=1925746 RepID=UPI002B4B2A77|nr:tetratricopeptide repeat protein [Lentibacillus sp.]HLR63287.1 tetratricopeptide repeat protein [Lentibacillus sp.]